METQSCKPDIPLSTEKKSERVNRAVQIILFVYRLVRVARWLDKHWSQIVEWLTNL